MQTNLNHNEFFDNQYISTNHWANAKDDFNSIVTVYNYYGYAYKEHSPKDTDAIVTVHLIDENGEMKRRIERELPTGDSLFLSVKEECPDFRGLVTLRMRPKGGMGRLRDHSGRPIASSYFMLYERKGAYRDFSHELFPVKSIPDQSAKEWASVVYSDMGIEPGVIVMNNCPLNNDESFGSEVELRLLDLKSNPIAEAHNFYLRPGGSKQLSLQEVFMDVDWKNIKSAVCCAAGKNIEQPMTVHLHRSGDFNIHHF